MRSFPKGLILRIQMAEKVMSKKAWLKTMKRPAPWIRSSE